MIYRIIGPHISKSVAVDLLGNERVLFDLWRELLAPELAIPRARFWFTKEGFMRFGLPLLAHPANHAGLRVVRQKNPRRSRIVYQDQWQVALLPNRGG